MGGEATFKKYGSTHFSKLKSDYWKKRKAEENKVTKVGKK